MNLPPGAPNLNDGSKAWRDWLRSLTDAELIEVRARFIQYEVKYEMQGRTWMVPLADEEKLSRFDSLVTRIAELDQDRAKATPSTTEVIERLTV